MSTRDLGTAFVQIEARTDKFIASAQKGISSAATKLGGAFSKPLVDASGKAGADAGKAFGAGLGSLAVPAALLLAGREITRFALGGVHDLVTLGKEVERFGTVAGVSAETASRFIGVATDFGVGADQVSLSVGFLGKTLGKNQAALDSFGVAIARNSRGDIDLAKTAFNVIDAYESMESTTKKAALGVAAFGRGYQALIPLLNVGSKEIQKAFASVSGGELFDQKKQDQAKALGVARVQIHKSIVDLQLTLAQGIAPGLEKLSTGLRTAAGGIRTADSATGGAVGTLAKYGTGAAAAALTINVLGSAVTRIKATLAASSGELTGFGLAARGAAGGFLILGAAIAVTDILNKLSTDAGRAKAAIDDLAFGLGRLRDSGGSGAQSLELLAKSAKELIASTNDFDSAGFKKTGGPFGTQIFDQAKQNLAAFKAAVDKALEADPKSGAQIRAALIGAANAADAGDVAERKYLDSLGLTDAEIDKLVTKLNLQTTAQAKAASATDDGSAALAKQVDNLHRVTSAIPFNTVVRQNLLDLEAKQTAADAAAASATQKLVDEYNAEQSALDKLKQAKIDLTDLTLSEEQAHFDAKQAVEAYQKALAGVPATVKDIADAEKQLADARVAFQKLLLEHPAIITPDFVLQKEAAQAAINVAQANLDEVRKGKVSTPAEIEAAFLNARRAIDAEAKAAAAAKEGLLKSLGKPFTLDDETKALIANLQLQEKAFGKNSPLGRAIEEHIAQLKTVADELLIISSTANIPIDAAIAAALGGGLVPGHAKGGPFKKGQPFVAGEKGWELVLPESDGTVLTHQQSVAAVIGAQMANRARVVSTPPPAPIVNARPLMGDVHIIESPDGRRTLSEVARAIRANQFLSGAN